MISKFKRNTLLGSILAIVMAVVVGCTSLTNAADNSVNRDSNTISSTSSIDDSNDSSTQEPVTVKPETSSNNNNSNTSDNTSINDKNSNDNTSDNDKNNKNTTTVNHSPNTAAEANSLPSISDTEILRLISNGYYSVTSMDKLRTPGREIQVKSMKYSYYTRINNKDIRDFNTLIKYFTDKLGLDKYFSNNFIKSYVAGVVDKIDGVYYMALGDFGIPFNFMKGKVLEKKYTDNKLELFVNLPSADADPDPNPVKFNIVLTSNNDKWLIDKMNVWGFPSLPNCVVK